MMPFRLFRCEPPHGAPFECAAFTNADGHLRLFSTRDGKWQAEKTFTLADMIFPEQDYDEWTIRKIEPREIAEIDLNNLT